MRSIARAHIKNLQVLQSKWLSIATSAPWYNGNSQIRDDLGVTYFSDLSDLREIRLEVS